MTPSAPHIELAVRLAGDADAARLTHLARLDSANPIDRHALLAEVDGELVAAISLTDGAVIADPFRRTAPAVGLLRMRADQLRAAR